MSSVDDEFDFSDTNVAIEYLLRNFPHRAGVLPVTISLNQSINQSNSQSNYQSNNQSNNQTVTVWMTQAGWIEPRLILVNQLYALVNDRTAVDRELERRQNFDQSINQSNNQSIRMVRFPQLGLDDYGFILTSEYKAIVQSFVSNNQSINQPAPEEKSMFAPEERPIKRRKKNNQSNDQSNKQSINPSSDTVKTENAVQSDQSVKQESGQTIKQSINQSNKSPAKTELDATNHRPSVPSTNQSVTQSTSHSINQTSNRSINPSPIVRDEIYLWRIWTEYFLPSNHQSISQSINQSINRTSINHEALIELLHVELNNQSINQSTNQSINQSVSFNHIYETLTDDQLIDRLFARSLIVRDQSLNQSNNQITYLFCLPHTTHIIQEILTARQSIKSIIKQSNNQTINQMSMFAKIRVKGSDRGIKFHCLEMIGKGLIQRIESPSRGTILRLID